MLGKIESRKKGAVEDEMVRLHQRLNGHECEQTRGDSQGQGSLACCSPRGRKESDMTELLNNNSQLHRILPHYRPEHQRYRYSS